MPTVVTHAFIGGAAAYGFGETQHRRRLWDFAILFSVLPDADVLGFRFGVKYGDVLGHRGFFHSPCFALIAALLCVAVFFRHVPAWTTRWWKHVAFLWLAGASHGMLDALTDGGLGIAFLSPLSNARYFAPWTPLSVSSIGLHDLMTGRFVHVMGLEMLWVWLPTAIIVCLNRRLRHQPLFGSVVPPPFR